jgi:transposase
MTDLSTLFARNPLDLTRDDITTLIEAYRKARHQFSQGNMTAGRTKPLTEKQKQVASLASKLDIKL